MKYNLDCLRSVLLTLEEEIKIVKVNDGAFDEEATRLSKLIEILGQDYSESDIIYSVQKLDEAEYITAHPGYGDGLIITADSLIFSITFKGHEFLENIRDSEVFQKTKKVGKAAGSFSLSIVGEIAKNIVLGLAQAALVQHGFPINQ